MEGVTDARDRSYWGHSHGRGGGPLLSGGPGGPQAYVSAGILTQQAAFIAAWGCMGASEQARRIMVHPFARAAIPLLCVCLGISVREALAYHYLLRQQGEKVGMHSGLRVNNGKWRETGES